MFNRKELNRLRELVKYYQNLVVGYNDIISDLKDELAKYRPGERVFRICFWGGESKDVRADGYAIHHEEGYIRFYKRARAYSSVTVYTVPITRYKDIETVILEDAECQQDEN